MPQCYNKILVLANKAKTERLLEKHIQYLQREGVGIGGSVPEPFNGSGKVEQAELNQWVNSAQKDRHHFRFIVAPENGSELDLKAYAGCVMRQMERDLGTKLSWVAVTHHNTDNPHVHILLRGIDENRRDLVISRDYISRGARIKAQELATRELGFRSEIDIARDRQRSITQGRIVGLDHELIKQAHFHPSGLIDMRQAPSPGHDTMHRTREMQLGRLNFLESLGLAVEVSSGVWQLGPGMLEKLHSLSIRNDIIKTMHRRMRGINPNAQINIFEPTKTPEKTIEGKILFVGLENELDDKRYIVIEDQKRAVHYVSLAAPSTQCRGKLELGETVKAGIQKGHLVIESVELGLGLDLSIQRTKI